MNEVGLNGKFSQLQLRYQALLEESANQIEMLGHLVNVVGPNIKSRYMILVGQLVKCKHFRALCDGSGKGTIFDAKTLSAWLMYKLST